MRDRMHGRERTAVGAPRERRWDAGEREKEEGKTREKNARTGLVRELVGGPGVQQHTHTLSLHRRRLGPPLGKPKHPTFVVSTIVSYSSSSVVILILRASSAVKGSLGLNISSFERSTNNQKQEKAPQQRGHTPSIGPSLFRSVMDTCPGDTPDSVPQTRVTYRR
jgi:hypothetical protein